MKQSLPDKSENMEYLNLNRMRQLPGNSNLLETTVCPGFMQGEALNS